VPELASLTGRPDLPAILRIAEAAGQVVAVERERYYSRTALEVFARAVRQVGSDGDVSVAGLRDVLGLSRKFLIPLLEWSDREGLTVRSGDTRRLRAPAGNQVPAP
jgi:selenocysteine-specific elongation factor